MNGRKMINFNSLVFRRSVSKAIYNAEVRTDHFCQDALQVFCFFFFCSSGFKKPSLALSSLNDSSEIIHTSAG